jgi:methylaspartate mutase epsilon subunit
LSFADWIRQARAGGKLVVQPRMGFSDPALMRVGLGATRAARAHTVGTITVDSYTRVRDFAAAARLLADGVPLNGYPVVTHEPEITRGMVREAGFPIQVRHGSPCPEEIMTALVACGIDATEGGPVSYCLPYGRISLRAALASWQRACHTFATLSERAGVRPHLESFGGCMMGQLCPPGLLVALTVLEAMFFRQHGIRDVSVSLTQQSNADQDLRALAALRRLATECLGTGSDWHMVVYTYMGLFPTTPAGARAVLADSVRLAVRSDAARLIVKSAAEAWRIPSIADNVEALEHAATVAEKVRAEALPAADNEIYYEARQLLDAVRELHPDLGRALVLAFERGYLDVPFCFHEDNAQRARSAVAPDGTIYWSDVGVMPLRGTADVRQSAAMSSQQLLDALTIVRRSYDFSD